MKKLQIFLVCGALLAGLVACDSSEETSKSSEKENIRSEETKNTNEKVEKSVESKQEEKTDTTSTDSKDLASDFKKLAPEMQLASYQALFHNVITSYDYGIGNPDYLLKETMTQAEIDAMKEELQKIKDAEKAGLLGAVNETRVHLMDDNISKVSDKAGLQEMFGSQDNLLKLAKDMITCLDSVTVENAAEKRAEMDTLQSAYIIEAQTGGILSREVAENSEMNVDQYIEAYGKLIGK